MNKETLINASKIEGVFVRKRRKWNGKWETQKIPLGQDYCNWNTEGTVSRRSGPPEYVRISKQQPFRQQ